MKHLGQNGHQRQKGQIVHFVFEKECQWRAYFGVCKYVQRNGTIPLTKICIFRFHVLIFQKKSPLFVASSPVQLSLYLRRSSYIAEPLSINALQYSTFMVEDVQGHVQGRALSVFSKFVRQKTKDATMMATSSLLLLRRCLWYRHTRWPTSSSMILLRYSGRRFVTTIVFGSQGYVEYEHPSMK